MEEHNTSNKHPEKRQKRKSGGQPGNQNALKHGFYSTSLTAAERKMLRKARRVTGLQNEIDFMRVKIWSMGGGPQVTLSHLSAAAHAIARLATVDHRITGHERESAELEERVENVLTTVGRAMGLGEFGGSEGTREGEAG